LIPHFYYYFVLLIAVGLILVLDNVNFATVVYGQSLLSSPEVPSTTYTPPPPTTTASTTPNTTANDASKVIIDRPTAARLAAQDPYFARFEQILANCNNLLFGNATITLEQCASSMQQGADRWCGFEFYDSLKCEYASFMAQQYNKMLGILGGNLFNELFPEGLLGPTP
jgi:hypothetical protein